MDWRERARALASSLQLSPEWREAFEATPRHMFVPRFFGNDPQRGWYTVSPEDGGFLDLVYADEALITQLDGDPDSWDKTRRDGIYYGGRATSSSSTPGLMADMLEALQVSPGMRVLEIGTGSGYNAALLCHRLGDRNVTTVDIDESVVGLAGERLAGLGYHPRLAVVNALQELPEGPYDRIITTVGPRSIPPLWLRAVEPGGRILTNLYSDLATDAIFALTVHPDGTATGRAPIGGTFMPTRDNMMPFNFELYSAGGPERTSLTRLPGEVLDDFGSFYLFTSLIMRDVQQYQSTTENGLRPGLIGRDGSWAYEANGVVVHGGPRQLWSTLEGIYARWLWHNCPGRERLGLTVNGDRQTVWVDSPERPVA